MTDPAHDPAHDPAEGTGGPSDGQDPAAPSGEPGAGDASRTEPGSDLPGTGDDDLQRVAEEVDAAMAGVAQEADLQPGAGGSDPLADALALADQRLTDLQRERAEFVNYRRRVERDREVAGAEGRTGVLLALLPVLDDIDGARTHGDLVGPFAAVADKLDGILRRIGLEPFGEVGEPFDPTLHEALLHDGETQVDEPTCTQVLQRGYRSGDRVLRPARVAVASPQ